MRTAELSKPGAKVLPEFSHLLPDENPEAYRRLRGELLAELSPRGAFQRRIAENLVDAEWDIQRHRRLMAALLRTEFRVQAGGVFEAGSPGQRQFSLDRRSDVEHGHLLLAGDDAALSAVTEAGVSLSEITAAAVVRRSDAVAYHEGRIADLERRRRFLLADFERLQARQAGAREIVDAEEVD